jgi:hypothetical protein
MFLVHHKEYFPLNIAFVSFPYKWLIFHSLNKLVQSMHDLHHVKTPQREKKNSARGIYHDWWPLLKDNRKLKTPACRETSTT